jgi:hypothetical protein
MSYYSSRPRRPRRSRFTVTFTDGDRTVILAYTGQDSQIREHYARMGKTVASIVKGDHRAPVAASGPSFVIDQSALADAIDLLGLKVPVKVRFNSRAGATNGNYRLRRAPGGLYHDIMLKSYHDAEQASSTLWHELCHAMQAERVMLAGEEWGSFTAAQKRWPYSRRPIQIEARQMSADMADCPLTRAR